MTEVGTSEMQCGAFSRRGSLKRNENGPCSCCCHLGCVPQPNTANVGTLPRKQLSAEIRHPPPKLLCEIVAGLIDLPSKPRFGEKETICQTPRGCEREQVGERKFNVTWNVIPALLAQTRQTRKQTA